MVKKKQAGTACAEHKFTTFAAQLCRYVRFVLTGLLLATFQPIKSLNGVEEH